MNLVNECFGVVFGVKDKTEKNTFRDYPPQPKNT